MTNQKDDLQPKPPIGGAGMGGFCPNAKLLSSNGPPVVPPVTGEGVLRIKNREGPHADKQLLPVGTTRGNSLAEAELNMFNYLLMCAFRRRIFRMKTCPQGTGRPKLCTNQVKI